MLEHFKGDEELVKLVLDYKMQAEKGKLILTKFLNPHEQDIVEKVIGHTLCIYKDGGFENSEYKRMIICEDYYGEQNDFEITLFEIEYNQKFGKLKHSDVLGALMHLGVKRDIYGDIHDNPLVISVDAKYKDYLKMNLKKIKKSSIQLKEIHERLTIQTEYQTQVHYLASFRLDKVVAASYHLSREKAQLLIERGDVKVNYKPCFETSKLIEHNDLLSVRHYGRVKLEKTEKTTKSNNYVVYAHYVK